MKLVLIAFLFLVSCSDGNSSSKIPDEEGFYQLPSADTVKIDSSTIKK